MFFNKHILKWSTEEKELKTTFQLFNNCSCQSFAHSVECVRIHVYCKWSTSITTSRCFLKCVFLKWRKLLDVVAWRLGSVLWEFLSVPSESVLNMFSFIQFEKGDIFWKGTLTMLKRLRKTGTIAQLKGPQAKNLWTYMYPLVHDLWMNLK